MVAPSNIVTGSIVANVNSLQQAGFGIPLVLGNTSTTIDKGSFNIFTNMIGVSAVFSDSDPEWIEANSIFSQNPTVQQIFIGRELDRVSQVATIVFSGNLVDGTAQQQTIVFSANIVASNKINGKVNGVAIAEVDFDTNNATTLSDLATVLQATAAIVTASSDGVHTITVTGKTDGVPVVLSDFLVTAGASQATVTITQTVAPVLADTVTGVINDTDITVPFNASNAQTLTDLATALTIASVSTAVSDGSHTVTVTSAIAGIPFVLSSWVVSGGGVPPTVVVTTTVDNVGLSDSLASIANVNNNFYAFIWCDRTKANVLYAFDVIEALPYFYMTVSSDAAILDPASITDVAYLCKAGNYGRSAVWYSAEANTHPLDGAVFGKNLPNPPGKVNWAFTQLNGVTADNLTQSEYAAALAKNCNVFVPFANVNLTYKGTCGSGLYIDYRIGIDWTNASMVTALFNTIAQLINGNKVPYSDQGVGMLEAAMYGVLEQGAQNQFIAPGILSPSNPTGYIVGALPVSQISQNDVAARYYPSLTFQATFLGAIDSCTYAGSISLP